MNNFGFIFISGIILALTGLVILLNYKTYEHFGTVLIYGGLIISFIIIIWAFFKSKSIKKKK